MPPTASFLPNSTWHLGKGKNVGGVWCADGKVMVQMRQGMRPRFRGKQITSLLLIDIALTSTMAPAVIGGS